MATVLLAPIIVFHEVPIFHDMIMHRIFAGKYKHSQPALTNCAEVDWTCKG